MGERAAHLAQAPIVLDPKPFGVRFENYTPKLKKRVLGGVSDARAEASVTFPIGSALWSALKQSRS